MTPGKFVYEYPRPGVTVDVAIVTEEEKPRVLLIRRKHEPGAGCWAMPGGFVNEDEPLEVAARRELFEETGIVARKLVQVYTFGDPGRDPRGWTITVLYLGRVSVKNAHACAADDAAEVGWFPVARPPVLAFDHKDMLACARKHLKERHA